jgi:hypothetical protein
VAGGFLTVRHFPFNGEDMRRAGSWLMFCVVLAGTAEGKLCGDDVDGRDVPCACGDVVVSDLRLGDDPVAAAPCPTDGLVVRARPGAARGLRIDLGGRTLRGSGRGRGLWIVAGGPGGAHVESTGQPAVVDGFGEGLVAVGEHTLAAARGLRVERPRRAGVRVHGRGWSLVDVAVTDAGGDGFSLGGSDFRVDGTRAVRSRGSGYAIAGRQGVLGDGGGLVAEESGADGLALSGRGHRLARCRVTASGRRDVRVSARDAVVTDCGEASPAPRGAGRRR